MNEYDSGKMVDVLRDQEGFVLTDQAEEANLILLNTCSIRDKAEKKVFSQLGQWRPYKQANPDLIIGVGGCVASQEGAAILKQAPYVDIVFGPQTIHRLPELYRQVKSTKQAVVDISFPEIEKFDHLPAAKADGPTAYVSIMEGCSKYCSFCVVPYTRGEEISRPFDDVLAEVAGLAAQGVREIILLGQNVNDYLGTTHEGGKADLAQLIEYIAVIEQIGRIRYTTSHPLAFSDRLIDAYANIPKLANHLHLPVQSGSDRILSAMKRGYTALEFKSKIRKLRKVRPDIRISSDFIVGFPGETDQDFQATMNLIHDIGFDHSFSFVYSKRPGTPAANLADATPETVKKQRLQIMQQRLTMQALRISESMIGKTQQILVSKISKKNDQELTGRTECNRLVNFPGDASLIGQFVTVKITEAKPHTLRGVLCEGRRSQEAPELNLVSN